nr:putative ribonuclease H-like domain-containing protein [Tanacetum cinerariifolium]
QEVKKNVSSLRYIALPNWAHDALLEYSSSKPQDHYSTEVPEGPTASTSNPPADQIETLTVKTPILTMDVKSAFLYGTIDEEVYVMQPPGFQDPESPAKVYKLEKAMYGLHQAPRAWYGTLSKYLLKNGFQRGTINQTLFIKKQRGDFILVQVYVDDIIFRSSNPQLCREFEALMHEKFQMSAIVKRIFKYLKGHPKLGLWYLKESPFDLVAYSDSDYGGATQDRKSTTGGCQFLGRRLISWQCKKQTIMATSITEAEYVAAASCGGQVLWIHNQLLDYEYNFMNTNIYIDNNSAICIVKNPVYHSKTKHIEIRHHFIRDCFEKKLISVDHIHNDENVADLLTKPFDAGRFKYLVCKLFLLLGKLSTVSVFLGFGLTFAGLIIDARLQTAKTLDLVWMWLGGDYENVFLIGEHNIVFHPMVDFIEASPLRIETTEEGTQILPTLDGIYRTVTESYLRRNIKLKDEEGISSLPDTELFENLTLMGYNISLNQKFTFQKSQFSHQWKIVPLFDTMLVQQGEGSGTLTEPQDTPSPEAQSPSHTTHTSPILPPVTTTSIPTVTLTKTTPIRQYTRRVRIAQSFVLPTIADEPASPLRDVSQEEAYPTDSGFIADQDRATIDKSSTLPYDSAPQVTSPIADEGSLQQTIPELTTLCTSLQRQLLELTGKFQAQEVEINRLKERVKMLEDRKGVAATRSRDDAPIKGRSIDEGEAATERISDDSEEMATVLTSMDAAIVLASGVVDVPTGSGSILTASTPAKEQVPTGSDVVPTASPIFTTATVEVMVESETPKKQKVQEHIDAEVARELEEKLEREDQRKAEQIARDAEIARIHAEEELQIMIDGLDRTNETVAKYLQEYQQFALELLIERRIELIIDLVKDFRGMTFEEVEAKFNSVWKQMEDFIPIGLKEESERIKRKGLSLEQESAKKQKTSKEVPEEAMSPKEVYTKGQMSYWKITRLGGQRNLHASGEGLHSKEGSSTYDDQLQALSGELLTDGE